MQNEAGAGGFDARPILEKFGQFDFGFVRLSAVQLCIRLTSGQGEGGSYKYLTQIQLP
jgi:hypothetical protein